MSGHTMGIRLNVFFDCSACRRVHEDICSFWGCGWELGSGMIPFFLFFFSVRRFHDNEHFLLPLLHLVF
jgi:hypothetical protein